MSRLATSPKLEADWKFYLTLIKEFFGHRNVENCYFKKQFLYTFDCERFNIVAPATGLMHYLKKDHHINHYSTHIMWNTFQITHDLLMKRNHSDMLHKITETASEQNFASSNDTFRTVVQQNMSQWAYHAKENKQDLESLNSTEKIHYLSEFHDTDSNNRPIKKPERCENALRIDLRTITSWKSVMPPLKLKVLKYGVNIMIIFNTACVV